MIAEVCSRYTLSTINWLSLSKPQTGLRSTCIVPVSCVTRKSVAKPSTVASSLLSAKSLRLPLFNVMADKGTSK